MNDRLYPLISKYALLLSLLYAFSYIFDVTINNYEFESDSINNAYILGAGLPVIFDLLLNIVAAFLVRRDINDYKVKTSYVFWATVIYRPLGIVAFLLFLIMQETNAKRFETNSHEAP